MIRRPALVALAVLAAGVLTGCASTTSPAAPSSGTYTMTISAVAEKADAISQDSCATGDPVAVYPDCARFVAEVGNLALAAQGAANGVPGSEMLMRTARRLSDEVGAFSTTGCVAAPGVAGPPAQTCGDGLRRIQEDLRVLHTSLDAARRSAPR